MVSQSRLTCDKFKPWAEMRCLQHPTKLNSSTHPYILTRISPLRVNGDWFGQLAIRTEVTAREAKGANYRSVQDGSSWGGATGRAGER